MQTLGINVMDVRLHRASVPKIRAGRGRDAHTWHVMGEFLQVKFSFMEKLMDSSKIAESQLYFYFEV